jgi:quinol monooxygenase YgiN
MAEQGSRYPGRMSQGLLILHVHVHVKPEHVDAFREATLANARESVKEPGIARFDVAQDTEDPTRFVLVEVYRTPEAPAAHKETAHYLKWRETVTPMMAEPRTSRKYVSCFPGNEGW